MRPSEKKIFDSRFIVLHLRRKIRNVQYTINMITIEKGKPKVQTIFEAVFGGAVDKLLKSDRGQFVDNLLVQLDTATGEVLVFDSNEVLLEKNIIFEWAEQHEKSGRLYRQALHYMRVVLAAMRSRKVFDNPIFMRPLKVLIVDDVFNEIETVFTLEGSEPLPEGKLMKNLEYDLQNFYRKIFGSLD